jgi:hypothetical protein
VRGVTRNASSEAAKALDPAVEVVEADLQVLATVEKAVAGSTFVFGVRSSILFYFILFTDPACRLRQQTVKKILRWKSLRNSSREETSSKRVRKPVLNSTFGGAFESFALY